MAGYHQKNPLTSPPGTNIRRLTLVFVDTIKELPITFILRPFDFDTLSVRIYQYAGDERMVEAILPAILIMTLGLIASMTLIPSLEKKN